MVAPPGAEVPGSRTTVGSSAGSLVWEPGSTVSVAVPAAALRGIGIVLLEPSAGPPMQMDVRLVDDTGSVVLSGTRDVNGFRSEVGDVVVALAGEDLESERGELVAELTLRGDRPLVLSAMAGRPATPRLVIMKPADDGLRLVRAGEASVYERLDALPRIRWAGTSAVEPVASTTIASLLQGESLPDVILDEPGPTDVASTAEVEVHEDSGDTIRASVQADGPGYLVVADALSDAFRATVDGEPAELRVADHGYVAVAVSRGAHEVELRYQQPYRGAGCRALGRRRAGCARPGCHQASALPVGVDGLLGAPRPGELPRPGPPAPRQPAASDAPLLTSTQCGGERVDVADREELRVPAGDLAVHGQVAGDHRGAAGQRLEHGQTEPLVHRRLHDARRAGHERTEDRRVEIAGADRVRGVDWRAPAGRPGQDQRRNGVVGCRGRAGARRPGPAAASAARSCRRTRCSARERRSPIVARLRAARRRATPRSRPSGVATTRSADRPYSAATSAAVASASQSTSAARATERGTSVSVAQRRRVHGVGWRR